MLLSAELRWFWKPSLETEAFLQWFKDPALHGLPAGGGRAEARRDEYLIAPGQRELGLKRRDHQPGSPAGGTEIKGLVHPSDEELSLGSLLAPVEVWAKWTSRALDLESFPRVIV